MSSEKPEQLLLGLDEHQRTAAEHLHGPLAIVAGAGSGKTRTISHRIAFGVATGAYAENRVLALSYTNRAAAELRTRLRSLGCAGVSVRTIHSAALAQLQFFWPQLTQSMAPKLVTNKHGMANEVLDQLKIRISEQERAALLAEIEYLRYSMTDIDSYPGIARPALALSPERFVEFFREYEKFKQRKRVVDWEDVILLTTGLLRNESRMLSHVHQQYRFFTVDEYQDISPLQQGLLETWLGDRDQLCVVGDPRQNIYSFAGASSEFLLDFEERYPDAKVVELSTNYRSGAQIVEMANRVGSFGPIGAVRPASSIPKVSGYPDSQAEAVAIAKAIAAQAKIRKLSEIAVLSRINSQLQPIEQELNRLGIESQLRGAGRFFRQPKVMQAFSAIRALRTTANDQPLFAQVSEILSALGWTSKQQKSKDWESLNWFIEVLDNLGEASLEEYIRELDDWEGSGHEPQSEAVTLATIHATKGLEWESVFVVGVNQGIFPISHAKSEAEKAEEKRLFYVAITRAKDELQISYGNDKQVSEFIPLIDSRS